VTWVFWAFLLIIQNASFTLVSRARNSKSLVYHAWASLFSNGIWFASQFILIDNIVQILKTSDLVLAVTTGTVYIGATMTGSLSMHYIAMHYLEKDKK
jgi:hypothetical protein